MKHRIFTGTFAALETCFTGLISEQQAGDPLAPVAVLIGSNILASYLKGCIAARGRAVANVRFFTFPDLVAKLGAGSRSGRPKPRLPHLGASLLLEEVLEARTPEAFARVAGFAGFRGALLDTFRDLRDAAVTPENLAKWLAESDVLTPDRGQHLLGLADLYQRFRARIAPFKDAAEDFRQASVAASQAGSIQGARSLLIYGIYDVTGIQADLLYCLKDALDLVYFIPYVDASATRFAAPFVESRMRELGVTPVALPSADGNDSRSELAQRIFAMSEAPADLAARFPLTADRSFALVSVPGESRAAVEVVREVLRAVRDGVIKGFYEAAVILRRPEEEVPILSEAFRLRRVPYFVHGGSAFSQRPLAQAVLAIAGLERELFSRRAILTAMELTAAALPAAAAATWDVAQWRALVNDARFLAGAESWDSGTSSLVREAHEQLRRAEAWAAAGGEEGEGEHHPPSISQARRRLESAQSLRSCWNALRQAAADWPETCAWREWARWLPERLEPLLGLSEDWPAFSTVFDDIGSLSDLGHDPASERPMSRGRIAAALVEALSDLTFPEGRFQRRGVNLLSVAAARGLRFPLVIIPGLEEGRFPARLRQDPLLLDAERLQIGRPSRLPLKSLRGEEEKLLFHMAVRSASKRVVLLSSRLDESSDRERIPSQFFLRCAAAAHGAALNLNELTPENVPGLRSVSLDNPGPGKDQIAVDESEIRLGLITEDPACARSALEAVARAEPQLMSGSIAYDRARWVRRLTDFDGRISDPGLRHMVRRKLEVGTSQLSSSRIEEYATCPYLFYLRRIQGLEKWEEEEQVEGLDPLARGQIIHSILEGFLRDFSTASFSATPEPILQEALTTRTMRVLEEGRPAAMPDLLWEIERDRLMATLQNWLQFEKERAGEDFRPAHLERAFGSFPGIIESAPCRLLGPHHAFEFRGRIDRIDVSRDGRRARVIDYKTGVLPRTMDQGKKSPLMAGEKIQLAVYCGALSQMEDLPAVKQIEGEYLHLQSATGDIAACTYDDGELRTALQRLPEVLEIIHEGIDNGVFFARARGRVRPEGHCGYCDFLLICGKDREQRETHKAADPAVVRFARILELDGTAEDEE